MKCRFLILHLSLLFSQLTAEEKESSEPILLYFEFGELSVPLSFYTENWDPNEKLPLKLPGIKVEEKNLIVDLDKAIKASRKEQDRLRSQNSCFSGSSPWIPPIELREMSCEEIEFDEMQEWANMR
jgi:hypothetical protein